jgi:hypothetical protein
MHANLYVEIAFLIVTQNLEGMKENIDKYYYVKIKKNLWQKYHNQ